MKDAHACGGSLPPAATRTIPAADCAPIATQIPADICRREGKGAFRSMVGIAEDECAIHATGPCRDPALWWSPRLWRAALEIPAKRLAEFAMD